MENKTAPQPLDTLMTKLGLSNADLVNASTDQLSFKMVQKGRSGRRLTMNCQEKILRALLAVKPDLKVKRRELFRYEPGESVVAGISDALASIRAKKITYPQFIDLLSQTGITRYAVDVAANRVTFYGSGGEAHIEQGPAQEEVIDHPAFLKRIHDAGIRAFEVNIRNRQIRYKGETQSYKEMIPLSDADQRTQAPKSEEKTAEKVINTDKAGKTKKAVRTMKAGKRWKAVKLHRVKTRRFKRSY
ncbi:MAG: hypothetical protein ACREH5_00690 [Candidatus Omnitrophota bacterium]